MGTVKRISLKDRIIKILYLQNITTTSKAESLTDIILHTIKVYTEKERNGQREVQRTG